MDATLAGYAWLPRMLDKARASRAGTLGHYRYPCPIDQRCLAGLGVEPEAFADLAARLDDAAVVEALRDLGVPGAQECWFDAVAEEHRLLHGP